MGSSGSEGSVERHQQDDGGQKMPRFLVGVLAAALVVNAYTLSNLFPYVGLMVRDLMDLQTMDESGFYAGYIASSFTFGRFLSGYFWGYVADAWGRKPVIITSLSSIAVLSIVFGLSESFAMAVTSRFVLGLLNGMMSAARTMVAEMCGPEHVVMGMSYLSGSRAIGIIVGPAIGGMLALPTETYPTLFPPSSLFGRHPFLLSNLAGAILALSILPIVVIYLPETKDLKKRVTEEREARGRCNGGRCQACDDNASNSYNGQICNSTHKTLKPSVYSPYPAGVSNNNNINSNKRGAGGQGGSNSLSVGSAAGRGVTIDAKGSRRPQSVSIAAHYSNTRSGVKRTAMHESDPNAKRKIDRRVSGGVGTGGGGGDDNDYGGGGRDGCCAGDRGRLKVAQTLSVNSTVNGSVSSSSSSLPRSLSSITTTAPPAFGGRARGQCTTPGGCSNIDGDDYDDGHATDGDHGVSVLTRSTAVTTDISSRGRQAGGRAARESSGRQLRGRENLAPAAAATAGNRGGNVLGCCGPDALINAGYVKVLLVMICFMSVANIGLDEIYPLWALSTTAVGGLNWTTSQIGQSLGIAGAGLAVYDFVLFPRLVQRLGIVTVQRASAILAIPVVLAIPNSKAIAGEAGTFELFVFLMFILACCTSALMASLTIASTSIVPAERRGQLGGLFMTAESFGRCLGPTGFATIYAWSISSDAPARVNHRLVFTLVALIYLLLLALAWRTLTLETLQLAPPPPVSWRVGRLVRGIGAKMELDVAGKCDRRAHNEALPLLTLKEGRL